MKNAIKQKSSVDEIHIHIDLLKHTD